MKAKNGFCVVNGFPQFWGHQKIFRILSLLCLTLLILNEAHAQSGVDIGSVAEWVEQRKPDFEVETPLSEIANGEYFLLYDEQTNVAAETESYYIHSAVRIVNESGLESNSQIKIVFDPEFENVTLHSIQVLREGSKFTQLDLSKIKIIQQERELEYQMYDGRLTALYLVEDLRVGDVLEFAYTLHGRNPAVFGFHSSKYSLSYSVPVAEHFIRLISDDPKMRYKVRGLDDVEVETSAKSGKKEFVIRQKRTPRQANESSVPGWYQQYASIEFSNADDWEEIVTWGVKTYSSFRASSADIQQLAHDISNKSGNKKEQIEAALRFVQDEIRYMGIEFGAGSYVPFDPDLTLQRRFGDCKDKVVLLWSLLTELGVDASPVLVNTRLTAGVEEYLPSIYVFNHVILKINFEGVEYWVDPTLSLEGGGLNSQETTSYRKGLVLAQGETGLTDSVKAEQVSPLVLVEEEFDVQGKGKQPTNFSVKTTYSGTRANAYRSSLSRNGRGSLEENNLDYYAYYYPSIKLNGKFEIQDNREKNQLVVVERYVIHDHWELDEGDDQYLIPFFTTEIESLLDEPDQINRKTPLALSHPVHFKQITTIKLPERWEIGSENDVLENDFFTFTNKLTYKQQVATKTVEYRSLQDYVPVEKIDTYLNELNKANDALGLSLTYGAPSQEDEDIPASFLVFSYFGFLVVAFIIMLIGLSKRKHISTGEAEFYPVAVWKFCVMCLFTLNVYGVYWVYKNWCFLRDKEHENVIPVMRTIFMMFFFYSFHQKLKAYCLKHGKEYRILDFMGGALAVLYFIVNVAASANSWVSLVGLLSFVCFIPFLLAINAMNSESSNQFRENSRFGLAHFMLVLLAGQIWIYVPLEALRVVPSAVVVKGEELWNKEIRFFNRIGVLKPSEELRLFYSNGFVSYKEDGNGLTDKRVFSYWKENARAKVDTKSAYFHEIEAIETKFAKNFTDHTVLTVLTADDEFYLYLSPEQGRDKLFISELRKSAGLKD